MHNGFLYCLSPFMQMITCLVSANCGCTFYQNNFAQNSYQVQESHSLITPCMLLDRHRANRAITKLLSLSLKPSRNTLSYAGAGAGAGLCKPHFALPLGSMLVSATRGCHRETVRVKQGLLAPACFLSLCHPSNAYAPQ